MSRTTSIHDSLAKARRLGVPFGIVSRQPLIWYSTPVAATQQVGKGVFGTVYKYELPSHRVHNSPPIYARGQVVVKISTGGSELDYIVGLSPPLTQEMAIMNGLDHPNVMPLLDAFVIESVGDIRGVMGLVLPYLGGGTLTELLDKAPIPIHTAKLISAQLLRAVAYLHSVDVLHGDIKPQNVLIYSMVESSPIHCVLTDFGLASMRRCYETTTKPAVFTLWYRAPEIILSDNGRYEFEADSWALGCVIAEILTTKALITGETVIGQLYKTFKIFGTPNEQTWPGVSNYIDWKSTFPKWPVPKAKNLLSIVPPDARSLIIGLMRYVPERRTTPLDALQDKWLAEVLPELEVGRLRAEPIKSLDCTSLTLSRHATIPVTAAQVAASTRIELETRLRNRYVTNPILYALSDRTLALARQIAAEVTAYNMRLDAIPIQNLSVYVASIVCGEYTIVEDYIVKWEQEEWWSNAERMVSTILAIHGADLYVATSHDILEILLEDEKKYKMNTMQAARLLLQCSYFTRVPLLYVPECISLLCLIMACAYTAQPFFHQSLVTRVGVSLIVDAIIMFWDDLKTIGWLVIGQDGKHHLSPTTAAQRETCRVGNLSLDTMLSTPSRLVELLSIV